MYKIQFTNDTPGSAGASWVTLYEYDQPEDEQCVKSAEIVEERNTIPSLTIEMFLGGAYTVDDFIPYRTMFRVVNSARNRTEFSGRVLTAASDMDESGAFAIKITCEGMAGLLHDSFMPLDESEQTFESFSQWIAYVINGYNSMQPTYKHFGSSHAVFSPDTSLFPVDKSFGSCQKCYDAFTELVTHCGGEWQVRCDDYLSAGPELYYAEQLGSTSITPVKASWNMKSGSRSQEPEQIVTRFYAYGPTDGDGNRISLPSPGYVESSADIVSKYGIICAAEAVQDIADQDALVSYAQQWLANNNNTNIDRYQYKFEALDLSLIGLDMDDFPLHSKHPIQNEVILGQDVTLEVVKRSVNVLAPQETTIEMGNLPTRLTDIVYGRTETDTDGAGDGGAGGDGILFGTVSKGAADGTGQVIVDGETEPRDGLFPCVTAAGRRAAVFDKGGKQYVIPVCKDLKISFAWTADTELPALGEPQYRIPAEGCPIGPDGNKVVDDILANHCWELYTLPDAIAVSPGQVVELPSIVDPHRATWGGHDWIEWHANGWYAADYWAPGASTGSGSNDVIFTPSSCDLDLTSVLPGSVLNPTITGATYSKAEGAASYSATISDTLRRGVSRGWTIQFYLPDGGESITGTLEADLSQLNGDFAVSLASLITVPVVSAGEETEGSALVLSVRVKEALGGKGYNVGDTITYTINLMCPPDCDGVTDVVLTHAIPIGLSGATASAGEILNGALTWEIGDMEQGESIGTTVTGALTDEAAGLFAIGASATYALAPSSSLPVEDNDTADEVTDGSGSPDDGDMTEPDELSVTASTTMAIKSVVEGKQPWYLTVETDKAEYVPNDRVRVYVYLDYDETLEQTAVPDYPFGNHDSFYDEITLYCDITHSSYGGSIG